MRGFVLVFVGLVCRIQGQRSEVADTVLSSSQQVVERKWSNSKTESAPAKKFAQLLSAFNPAARPVAFSPDCSRSKGGHLFFTNADIAGLRRNAGVPRLQDSSPPEVDEETRKKQAEVARATLAAGFDLLARMHGAEFELRHESFCAHRALVEGCRDVNRGEHAAIAQAAIEEFGLKSQAAVVSADIAGRRTEAYINGANPQKSEIDRAARNLHAAVLANTAYEPVLKAVPYGFASKNPSQEALVGQLINHAEKRALADLLLKGNEKFTLRVNFGVCADCHLFFKNAAMMLRQPIKLCEPVGQPIHDFDIYGSCSCGL